MPKPLIFDPSTGELISNVREATVGSQKVVQLPETPAPQAAPKGVPSFEERFFEILCKGGEPQRIDVLRNIAADKNHEWSARIVAAVICQLTGTTPAIKSEAMRVAQKLGFQAAVIPIIKTILRGGDLNAKLTVLSLAESYGAQGTALADCILPVLESSNADLADAAARAVGCVGLTPSSVEELSSLIRHREARVRILCVRTLGMLGARAAVVSGLVVLRLDDPEAEVRALAAESLAEMGFHDSAMDEVERLLNHGNVERRIEMLRILGRFGSSAQASSVLIIPLLKCDRPEVCDAARRTLRIVGLSKDCFKQIEHLARHPQHDIRSAALDLLEGCGDSPEGGMLAISLMADRDLGLRERAAHVIARNGISAASLPALRKLLRDERDGVRILTLGALEKAGEAARPSAKLILERMEDANMEVASKAAKAFAALGNVEDCIGDMQRILHNRRQDRRLLMLVTLRDIGHNAAAALPLVTSSMGDPDWVVRDAACEAFIAIGFHDSCLPEVRRLIKHQDRNYRLAVIKALGACGLNAAGAEDFLTQRESDGDAEVGKAAKEALDAIRGNAK